MLQLDGSEVERSRGFGFTLRGGRERREPITIESVLEGGEAQRAGLQPHDQVLELQCELVHDVPLAKVNPIVREAMRRGELAMRLRRMKQPTNSKADT